MIVLIKCFGYYLILHNEDKLKNTDTWINLNKNEVLSWCRPQTKLGHCTGVGTMIFLGPMKIF